MIWSQHDKIKNLTWFMIQVLWCLEPFLFIKEQFIIIHNLMSEVRPLTHLPDSQSVHLYSHVPPRTMELRPSPLIIAEAVTLSQVHRPDNRHCGCDRPAWGGSLRCWPLCFWDWQTYRWWWRSSRHSVWLGQDCCRSLSSCFCSQ